MVQLGLLTAEAAGLFVAPGAPGPFPAAFPAGNALVDASSASIISCNAERGDCIVEGCRPRRARRDGEGVVGHVTLCRLLYPCTTSTVSVGGALVLLGCKIERHNSRVAPASIGA